MATCQIASLVGDRPYLSIILETKLVLTGDQCIFVSQLQYRRIDPIENSILESPFGNSTVFPCLNFRVLTFDPVIYIELAEVFKKEFFVAELLLAQQLTAVSTSTKTFLGTVQSTSGRCIHKLENGRRI